MKSKEIDRIQNAIRHIKTSVDIDSWAMEIAVEAMKKYSEVPNSSDCISRQAAIDAVFKDDRNTTIKQRLEALPPAKPEPQWIPVSERLPKDGTEVFVYMFDPPSPFIAWIEDTRWHTDEFEVEREDDPIAWMPLPDPYRAERRTDNANIDT